MPVDWWLLTGITVTETRVPASRLPARNGLFQLCLFGFITFGEHNLEDNSRLVQQIDDLTVYRFQTMT